MSEIEYTLEDEQAPGDPTAQDILIPRSLQRWVMPRSRRAPAQSQEQADDQFQTDTYLSSLTNATLDRQHRQILTRLYYMNQVTDRYEPLAGSASLSEVIDRVNQLAANLDLLNQQIGTLIVTAKVALTSTSRLTVLPGQEPNGEG